MSILNKAGFALVALSALGLTTSAHAMGNIAVTPTITGGPGAYTYSYGVTPTNFDATNLLFTFSDPNVAFSSVSGPLGTVNATSNGSFVNYSVTGGTLIANSAKNPPADETIVFTSTDGPQGTLGVSGTGTFLGSAFGGASIPVVGPSPVPEASTTASFGLLLALGLGGLAVAARKKSVKA